MRAIPVIVALAPGGQPEMKTFFDQFDIWIAQLNQAFARVASKPKTKSSSRGKTKKAAKSESAQA